MTAADRTLNWRGVIEEYREFLPVTTTMSAQTLCSNRTQLPMILLAM